MAMEQGVVNRRRLREPVSAVTHLAAAAVAALGLVLLLVLAAGDQVKSVALLIYGLSLVTMFASSGMYHMANVSPARLKWLRKVDHSAIYLLIAGTYTPICLHYFTGFWSTGLLVIVWTMALIGVVVKLFVINARRWVNAGVYLVMGWLCVAATGEMVRTMPAAAIVWLAVGGLLFTFGAVIYIIKRPDPWPGVFGFHEVWHVFIMLATAAHFVVMARYVAAG